ncbi:ras-related protein Rab-18-like [Tropilaelaps mercedesae]|uniref:Ras-related protein Rab-18-like n=1 Tax=Tropilaelaps mercedesae TaxID=418985 RepID=A0A1V9X9U5_9ACAR|nr:ras-related protein Rab-18-like [Tropilaelaps mercedesae]
MAKTPITTLKILLMGEASVGKTCLLIRFAEDVFDEAVTSTIGFDCKRKVITVNDEQVKVAFWDTAGSERFHTLTNAYYRGAQGAILVYDVTCRESFERLDYWLSELDMYGTYSNVVKMLVGNKVDKEAERKTSRREGMIYALKHQMLFVETSARTSENVIDCFEELVAKILETPDLWEASSGLRLHDDDAGRQSPSFCSYC